MNTEIKELMRLAAHPRVGAVYINGANNGMSIKLNPKAPAPEDEIEKRRQTLEKFLTTEEQFKYGDRGVLVQIERGMETPQVLDWFKVAEQDLGAKCMLGGMKCNGQNENWCNGWLGSRWSDMTINKRFVRVAFYEQSEDPSVFEKYTDWRIGYDENGEPARYRVRPGQHKYLLVINPYYHDETNDNWRPVGVKATCILCDKKCEDEFGNNALPLENGPCCNRCNVDAVIPARMFVANKTLEKCIGLDFAEFYANVKQKGPARTKEVRYIQALRKMNELVKDGIEKDADCFTIDFIKAVRKIAIDEEEANEFIINWQTDFRRTPGVNEFVEPVEDAKKRREAVLRMIVECQGRGVPAEEIKEKIAKMCNGVIAEEVSIMKEYNRMCKEAEQQAKDQTAAAEAAEALLLAELNKEPKPIKKEPKKKVKRADKFACACGDKNCMPRPAKTAWVNGVKRDQSFLQRAWDNKHNSNGKHSDSSSDI